MAAGRTALVSYCNSTWKGLIAICLIQPSNRFDREDWNEFSEFLSDGPRRVAHRGDLRICRSIPRPRAATGGPVAVRSGRLQSVSSRRVWRLFARRGSPRENRATTENSKPPISQPLSRYEHRERNGPRKFYWDRV